MLMCQQTMVPSEALCIKHTDQNRETSPLFIKKIGWSPDHLRRFIQMLTNN